MAEVCSATEDVHISDENVPTAREPMDVWIVKPLSHGAGTLILPKQISYADARYICRVVHSLAEAARP